MKIQILAASLLFASSVHAQESLGETQSIRCSALANVMTNISSPPAFNEAMAQTTEFYSGVFAAFRETRTGASATHGEVSGRRDTVLVELRKTWQTNPEGVVQELALCNSWRAEFGPRISTLAGEVRDGKRLIEIVGAPPNMAKPGEADKWRPIAQTAFIAWAAAGSKTGGEARTEIKKKLIESMKK